MAMTTTIHLIDASPYIFRAYFSIPSSVKARDGNPANAVHGFTTFLLAYREAHAPTHAMVAFDESLTTSFRNDLYAPYKAQRELPPAELEAQLRDCRLMAEGLGFPCFADDRYEADDLIATALAQLLGKGRCFVVVSPDKDLAQLVAPGVELFDFAKEQRYDAAGVEAKMGVRPNQVRDLLALAGDAVDNIPGVRGIGQKTAAALLAALGDLDEIYARLDEVDRLPIRGAKAVRAKLEASRDMAFLSRTLATVSTDAPIRVTLGGLAVRESDTARLESLLDRLGFGTLRRKVLGA